MVHCAFRPKEPQHLLRVRHQGLVDGHSRPKYVFNPSPDAVAKHGEYIAEGVSMLTRHLLHNFVLSDCSHER